MKRPLPQLLAITVILGFITFSLTRTRATDLKIERGNEQTTISWPTGAVGYVLERSDTLPTSSWLAVSNLPTVDGDWFLLSAKSTNSSRFYRLSAPSPTGPSLSGIDTPSTLSFGADGLLSFNYTDPDCDIVAVEITQSNALGSFTTTVPSTFLELSAPDGTISLPLETSRLAFGANSFSVRLLDSGGRESAPETFALDLSGIATGGTPPSLTDVTLMTSSARRPTGSSDELRVSIQLSYSDKDADIERLRVQVFDDNNFLGGAEYPAAAFGITGSSGSTDTPSLTFRSTDAAGGYSIRFTLIDRNGNVSPTINRTFNLQTSGGFAPLSISGFSPDSGEPGTLVTLQGSGFLFNQPAAHRVTLNGVELEVVEAKSSSLTVVAPSNTLSGKIRVELEERVAFSENEFVIPEEIMLDPANPVVSVGGRIEFQAGILAAGVADLVWSVDGIPGGSAALGTISPNGVYRAPADLPPGRTVTLSAHLSNKPSVSGQTDISLQPPPSIPGRTLILASAGGTTSSVDGRSSVGVPAGTLLFDEFITVATLHGTDKPMAPAGQRIIGAAEFGPAGLTFNTPVTIHLPLDNYYEPGTLLPLRLYDSTNAIFVDEGIAAKVSSSGEQATAEVSHFSVYSVVVPVLTTSGPPPVIGSITPSSALEGTRFPVHLTGSNLFPDLEVEILKDGLPTGDIIHETLYAVTNQAGVVLQVNTVTDLAADESRVYTLRLKWPDDSSFADVNFTVNGLDEYTIAAGQNVVLNNPDNNRFSEIRVESNAVVNVPMGHLNLEATGPIVIDGKILAEGSDGTSAVGQSGGFGAGGQTPGGNGARGRDEGGCGGLDLLAAMYGVPQPFDCAPSTAYGLAGNFIAEHIGKPHGMGGLPGESEDIGTFEILSNLVNCGLGNWLACAQAVGGIIVIVDTLSDINAGKGLGRPGENGVPESHPSAPMSGFGNGGGGGGGAGELQVDWVSDPTGGGGGGGGSGGRPVSLASGDQILINGTLSTMGGDGGDGAPSPDSIRVPFPMNVIVGDRVHGFSGGGGGAGSGGRITLTAAKGVIQGSDGVYVSHGGQAGKRILFTDGNNTVAMLRPGFARGSAGLSRVTDPIRARVIGGASFALPTNALPAETRVTFTGIVQARLYNGITLRVIHNGVTNDILGQPEPLISTYAVRPYRAVAQLQPGLNTLLIPGMHDLLVKQILYLPAGDSDGDGLGDPDEAQFGTDPDHEDTDRDGRNDLVEILAGHDPLEPDMDGDFVLDGLEIARGTDPLNVDSDADGLWDGVESILATNPTMSNAPPAFLTGLVFARVQNSQSENRLALLNPVTGEIGVIGNPTDNSPFGLAFDPEQRLWVAKPDSAFQLSTPLLADSDGVMTAIDHFTFTDGIHVQPLAGDRSAGYLYGVEVGATEPHSRTGQLVEIVPGISTSTRLGTATSAIHSLVLDCNETLFAATADGGSDRLVELDRASGNLIQDIGPIGFTNIGGMAFTFDGDLLSTAVIATNESKLVQVSLADGNATVIATMTHPVFDLAIPPCPTPCFATMTANNLFTAGATPIGAILADMNNDGDADLLVANRNDQAVSVSLGNGLGGFGPAIRFPVASSDPNLSVFTPFVAHLNGDTNLDVLVATFRRDRSGAPGTNTVTLLFGDGTGALGSPEVIPMHAQVGAPAAADLNQDGYADLIIPLVTEEILILTNDSTGVFSEHQRILFEESGFSLRPSFVSLGDLDEDGNLDAVVSEIDFDGGEELAVFFGDGTGNLNWSRTIDLRPGGNFSFTGGPMIIEDMDGDNHADLVTLVRDWSSLTPDFMFLLAGDGSGNLASPEEFELPFASFSGMALGQFDANPLPDIVVSSADTASELYFLLNAGSPDFVDGPSYPLTDTPNSVAVGDLNHDGLIDAVAIINEGSPPPLVSTNNVNVLLGQPPCK